jgi:hypothetical protein
LTNSVKNPLTAFATWAFKTHSPFTTVIFGRDSFVVVCWDDSSFTDHKSSTSTIEAKARGKISTNDQKRKL